MPFFCIKMNIEELKNIIEPVVNRNDCILWGIEILRGKKRNTLRIYIDSDQNININDCENVSRDLSYEPSLDMNFGDDYILEVSTPGIDRKFFNISQLNSFIGEDLELRTKELINGKRKFWGKLKQCNDISFLIEEPKESDILKFKFTDIDLCKLKPNYNNLMKESTYAK